VNRTSAVGVTPTDCGRQVCRQCGEVLIHRDHRQATESSSSLGQIVGRDGPVNLSVMDLDLVSRKGLKDGLQLLRLIEQKQPSHVFRPVQHRTHQLLDACLAHCGRCEGAADLALDPRSGVLLLRGHIVGDPTGEPRFVGPQELEPLRPGGETHLLSSQEEFFQVLDPEDPRRRSGIKWKNG